MMQVAAPANASKKSAYRESPAPWLYYTESTHQEAESPFISFHYAYGYSYLPMHCQHPFQNLQSINQLFSEGLAQNKLPQDWNNIQCIERHLKAVITHPLKLSLCKL